MLNIDGKYVKSSIHIRVKMSGGGGEGGLHIPNACCCGTVSQVMIEASNQAAWGNTHCCLHSKVVGVCLAHYEGHHLSGVST